MGLKKSDQDIISARFLFSSYLSCQALGARKPVLLAALGMEEAELRNPERRFSMQVLAALCQAAAMELGCRNTPSRIGCGLVPHGFSDLGYSAKFQQSWAESLTEFFALLDVGEKGSVLRMVRSVDGDRLYWNQGNGRSTNMVEACVVEVIFSAVTHVLDDWSTSGLPVIKSIRFRHGETSGMRNPSNTQHGNTVTACYFGERESYIEFFPGMLDLQNPHHNQIIAQSERRHKQHAARLESARVTLAKQCYDYLLPLLDKSGLNLAAAANTMGVAERTLRRKLVNENTSFRTILEQVRKDACRLYFLENMLSLTEIAAKLGYSELSAFTRAYTGWYGHPPSRDFPPQTLLAA